MKFSLPASDFAIAVKKAAGILPARGVIEILGHALINAGTDGFVTLTTHDLDRSLVLRVTADVAEPGTATCDAKRLAKLVAAIDGKSTVTISADDKALTLQAGRSRFKFPVLAPDDFPLPPAPQSQIEQVTA